MKPGTVRAKQFLPALTIGFYFALGLCAFGQDTVSIKLAQVNTETGLFLREPDGGATTVVTKGGSAGRSTAPPADQVGGYMYFATDPAFANEGSVDTLFVTVEYFDEGTDQFRLEYDAQPDPDFPNPDADAYTGAQAGAAIAKYDTRKWVTYQFRLANTYFGKRQLGEADFRINDLTLDVNGFPVEGEAPEVIRTVVVSKTEPIPLHIKFAATPVKVDGVLDDAAWKDAQPFRVDSAIQDVIRPTKWTGTNDYSLDARYAWDNTALYIGYDVTDDVPRASLDDPSQAWNGDGTEIYFGFDQSKPGRTTYLPDTDFQIAITVGPNPTWEVLQGGAIIWTPTEGGPFQPADYIVVKDSPRGYILEAKIPWAMLVGPSGITNAPPIPGQLAGFNVFGNDGDNLDAPAQEKAMSFTGRPQAYLNPGAWATVQMDPPAPTAPPQLRIAVKSGTQLRISWPADATGFALQQCTALPGGWTAVTAQVSAENQENYVLVQAQGTAAYFRLTK
ncbi:MAG: sugar-binding protein [Verrucomicrobiia bacterium]